MAHTLSPPGSNYSGSNQYYSNPDQNFNHYDYQAGATSSYIPPVQSSNPAQVLKSGGIDLAEPDIKGLLDSLRPFAGTEIKDLPAHMGQKFNQLLVYIDLLHDSHEYDKLYEWVVERYNDVRTIRPATVGAYMYGCSARTSFSDSQPGCAVVCAGSMPKPINHNSSKQSYCRNTVLAANFDLNKYDFTLLNRGDGSNHENAYVYISSPYHQHRSRLNHKKYVGFSPEEKSRLKALGIMNIKLYGYGPDGRNYVELSSDLIPVDDLKPRYRKNYQSDHTDSYRPDSRDHYDEPPDSGSKAIWIIVVVIIFLVIIFLVWQYYVRSKSPEDINNDFLESEVLVDDRSEV